MKIAKQKIVIMLISAICFSFGIAGTIAYLTDSSVSHNIIETAPGVSLLVDTQPESVLPGDQIENTGIIRATADSAPAWVRAKANMRITLLGDGIPDASLISISYNNDSWIDGNDGWWYYKDKLNPGSKTAPLIKSINFDGLYMGQMYDNADITIEITVQGVQWQNNHNGNSPLTAEGWPSN